MSAVAEWPNRNQRKAIRSTPNPLDKSTIVSIYPKAIHEVKYTMQPGVFDIDKGSYEKPAILVVGTSSWFKSLEYNQPLIEIPVGSMVVADSVIKDYANGLDGCDMAGAMPGLFFVPGVKTLMEIKKDYKELLDIAAEKQKNWYTSLVQLADILWARSNGNPLSISDDARLAAQELQLKDKAWMQDFQTLELKNCPACGFLRSNNYPVCSNCHIVIDAEQFKKLGFSFAQVNKQ